MGMGPDTLTTTSTSCRTAIGRGTGGAVNPTAATTPRSALSRWPGIRLPTTGRDVDRSSPQPLVRRGDALAAPDAHRDQRAVGVGPTHLVERLDGEDRPGGGHRVAQGDAAAVWVGLLPRQVQVADHRQRLSREGLVE